VAAADLQREVGPVPVQAASVVRVVVVDALEVDASREERMNGRMLEHIVIERGGTAALRADDDEIWPPAAGRT